MIWSDAILSIRKHHPNMKDWKLRIFIYVTWIHGLNWWIIYIWSKFFKLFNFSLIHVDIFTGDMIDEFISFTIMFVLPFRILNYFLIFYKNRYEKITQKYKNIKFRYAPAYSFTIAILAFASAVLYGILN